jgi:serine-type D-Ala-D-Ala carboxypeptidase (penicillin-binding protein 5/6)
MNQKARSLGALHSHFLDPTGLPQRGQVTTARDLAMITKAALANPEFRRIVATKSYPWKSSKWEGVLDNSNELLKSYDGAIGVKTGNTREAGYCLVAAAQRRDQTFIAVILGSQEKHVWQDAKKLLDYGFKNSTDVAPGGRPLTSR